MSRIKNGRSVLGFVLIAIAAAFLQAVAGQNQQARVAAAPPQQNLPPDLAGLARVPGWVLSGTPRRYTAESLYGYVDGGAEIFLQYGFRDLRVLRFLPAKPDPKSGREITLELYRMASPATAFGIFSTRREGDEPVSAAIRTVHWLGADQAGLVKGDLYANILASGCDQATVEEFVLAVDRELPPAEEIVPPGIAVMPEFSLAPRTERYILGGEAAVNESPLLGADFWGFKEGLAEAYSARYGSGTSKLILIHFKQPPQDLAGKVYRLFEEHAMRVSMSDNVVQGGIPTGGSFYFGENGSDGALVLNEPDPKIARERIQEALDKAAKRLREPPKDKPVKKLS